MTSRDTNSVRAGGSWMVIRLLVCALVMLAASSAHAQAADDAVLVDGQRDRDGRNLQQVERVDQDGPAHPLPLHEQTGSVGVLLLDDADHLYGTSLLLQLGRFVPPGHVHAAARSPGSEDVQHHLLAAEVRQARGGAVLERRKGEIGEEVAHGEG